MGKYDGSNPQMAYCGVGNNFVSVNLNKSYGQQSSKHHYPSHYSGSYGSNRGRTVAGGRGGGGMVVLSRPRSSQKAGPKLSVPPPLNLPSMRKEHERFDSLGTSGMPAGGGISGNGPRPTSSGMGWTKPVTVVLQEKEGWHGNHVNSGVDQSSNIDDGISRGNCGVPVSPSARLCLVGPNISVSASTQGFPPLDKATVLRGEDFPSLKAALPIVSGTEKKHKDGLCQKQKPLARELSNEQRDGSRSSSVIDMRPQLHSGRIAADNGLSENGSEGHGVIGSRLLEQGKKPDDYFPVPLPLVHLNPRSDWADDERDTGQGFTDRGRDHGYSKNEVYWDRAIDMPRAGVLPHRPAHSPLDKWGQHDNETRRTPSSEVSKLDPYGRNRKVPSREGREGNSWRVSSPLRKERIGSHEIASDKNAFGSMSSSGSKEKESKYISSPSRDNDRDDIGKRDVGYGNGEKQAWINTTERNVRDHYGNEQYNRYKGDAFYNSSFSKSSSYGGKRFPANDPGLNLGIAKRPLSKNEKPYLEDPFLKDFGATGFDGRNPFASNLVGVIKRKDVHKQTDFLDPVRESFEAELERVQNMQEQERQRIVAEQERALEEARREEEDRLQLAREKEEQQRRIEEEAREAAWRAEQEQLEALQREEEQRIAREEEKHRILMEEERRKQAAKQKLLELEERIAKRQADTCKSGGNISAGADEKNSGMEKERDASKATDVSDWEDAERMVERITTSASSDSSGLNRSFEMTSHPHFSSASEFSDRAKPFNSWRRDVFENGNSSAFTGHETENGNRSPRPRRDIGGRPFPRKDFYGATPYISSRPYYKLRVPESHMDDFGQPKVLQSLNVSADGDCHGRNTAIESGYHDNLAQNYGDAPRGQHCRGIIYPPNPERFYNNPEVDGLSSFGRSRYSVKQPRVLPPPSVSSMQKTSYRGENVCPGPSTFQENEGQSTHARRSGFGLEGVYDSGRQDDLGQHKILVRQTDNTNNEAQKVEDSQSSLSVSSPPDSPIHLSHDELDVFGDSTVSSVEEGKEAGLSVQGIEPFTVEAGKENVQIASSSISAGEDDEWPIDNKQLQVQEEYDEDEDGYQEEDEVHEEDDGNVDLMQEFNEMHLEDKQSPDMMDNLVLGFNEGVEVSIPNDEFDESSRKEDSAYSISQISVGTVEEKASFDGINSDRKPLQSMDSSFQGSLDNSRIFQETKKPMQDLVIQPTADPKSCEVMDNVDATGSSNGLAEHTLPYSVVTASNSTSGLSGTPNASVPTKDEVPVKLQFGLFSGPTLIPSPVLSLQIGSMPLNLHPEVRVGQSSGQMHTSQRPLFQFGQLRYTSPISQGMLPLAPQSLSFVHPNVSANLSLNQKPGIPFQQSSQDTSVLNLIKTEVSSLLENQSGLPRSWDLSHGNVLKEESSIPARENRENVVTKHGHVGILNIGENTTWSDSSFLSEYQGHQNSVCGDSKPLSSKQSGSDIQTVLTSSQSAPKDKILSGVRGQTYSNRGKKYAFAVKGPRSAFPSSEASRQESTGYQRRARRPRTEFKIKENSDKKQSSRMVSSNQINQVELAEKSSANESSGFSTREGVRKVTLNKSKQTVESEYSTSVLGSYLQINSGNRNGKGLGKESLMRSLNVPHSEESNLKRDIEKDVDPPLESGIVRIFEQPGIEAASDGDDFIEVRSKRQMLNDRREQREKEIKAKSRITKMPRKPRSIPQRSTVSACSHRTASASGEETENVGSDFFTTEGRNLSNNESATGFVATIVSQPLAPIGTPATKIDAQPDIRTHALKPLQTSSLPAASGCGPNLGAGFMFESDHKVLDNVQTSLGLWGNLCTSQQVLTQVQLDDALKPSQVDTCAPFGDHTSPIMDPSMLLKGKSSPAASALNTLFAGEKIQFGAVTSPTVLPSGVRVASHGIGHPGPSRSEIQMSHHVYEAENDCSFFFEKKNSNESCLHLEDCGAEAETAASAVAVAAITNDEIVGKVMSTCTVSASDDRGFGVGCSRQLASQSKAEESLSVSLPADLSVENPPISLWPPLPSPQNSSQMISHIPGGHPSQVPFYEMNPMIGGPIFAFGPHEESSSSQLQPQKSSSPASGPLGTWHQCPSGVDSFYGPATGFTGHFIPRPGGIPGIQGPPHMFVYNHFAPVGQFGLSFMGATYIPSGEQPDWKNKPASSAIGEGDVNNLNMASSQHNSSNMPAQIQHLAPGHGSPLLPMASPLAMFDVSPFQAVPSSFPLQQQAVVLPSGFRHVPPVDKSLASDRFLETQTSASDANLKFPVTTEATFTQLPDELGLVEASSSTIATTSAQHVPKSLSLTEVADTGNTDGQNGGGIKSNCQTTISAVKSPSSQRKNISPSQNYCNSSGYGHQRGSGVSPKNGSGEWSHRRMGFQGRNQSVVGDKYGKVKQIYVAKQTSKGTST